jgi:geranylgeranyl reductase family protein
VSGPQTDLLIVGAGPAGAATAIRGARAGLRTVLVDRAWFPRDKPCAEYLSPETLRQLRLLGVLEAVDRLAGHPLAGTTVIGPRGARLTGLFARAEPRPFRPTGLALPRRLLDQVLVSAARTAGAEVRQGNLVTDLLYHDGAVAGAVLRDRSGRSVTMKARLTIGADGLRSMVARSLGSRRHGLPARMALVAYVGVDELTDRAEMHVGDFGYAGLNPLGNGVANVSLVVPASAMDGAKGRSTEFFFDMLGRFPSIGNRVRPSRLARPVQVTGPFSARSRRVIAPGALLVGDAAEFFDPFTGEGICRALRGAALAAETAKEALARPGTVRTARLRSYVRARRACFAGGWVVERTIGFGMFLPRLFDRTVDRIERRGWSHTLIGVTGDFVPASELLRPRFLAQMVW